MNAFSFRKCLGIVLGSFAISSAGLAIADDHGHGCSAAKIRGTYAFFQQGSIVGIAPLPVPAADVGIFHADGNGNMTGSEVVNAGGQVFSDTFTDGVYEVNPDCTGTATWTAVFSDGRPPQTRTASLVVTDKFEEIYILSTAPGTVLVGTARKR